MTYRQSAPLRNILPDWNLLRASFAASLVLAGVGAGACCAPRSGEGPAPKASSPFRFEPVSGDHSDLALGETAVDRIALVAEAPTDWRTLQLLSSCECMSARFVDGADPKRAWVEVEFHGDRVEDIDAVVTVNDAQKRDLATYVAPLKVRRAPYVQPRKVVLGAAGSGRFEIVVGQAFTRNEKPPIAILDDVRIGDESLLSLVDAPDEPPSTSDGTTFLRTRLAFELNEAARARPGRTTLTFRIGSPVVERAVEVSWPGNH